MVARRAGLSHSSVGAGESRETARWLTVTACLRRRWPWILVFVAWGGSLVGLACWLPPSSTAYVPPYARQPYAPFGRDAAVAIAKREWRAFGKVVVDTTDVETSNEDKAERQEGLWQRIGDYWWLGPKSDDPDRVWTGKHQEKGAIFPPDQDGVYAWSAAFIDYIMRMAGTGDRFPYGISHSVYINAAAIAVREPASSAGVLAKRPELYAPKLGDLVCAGRHDRAGITFGELPAGLFPSHCVIVVDATLDGLSVIGGNVNDAVALTHVPVTPDGKLSTPDSHVIDTRYPWFVVLAVQYER